MFIGDYKFEVEKAVLKAVLRPEHFAWHLDIHARGMLNGKQVTPYAYSQYLVYPVGAVRKWTDIIDKKITWAEAYSEKLNNPRGNLMVYSHEAIDDVEIDCDLIGNTDFELMWTGFTDVSAEEFDDYDKVPFKVVTRASFIGIETCDVPAGLEMNTIKKYITESNFRLKCDDGSFRLFEPC